MEKDAALRKVEFVEYFFKGNTIFKIPTLKTSRRRDNNRTQMPLWATDIFSNYFESKSVVEECAILGGALGLHSFSL